jgi:hypothetical protein
MVFDITNPQGLAFRSQTSCLFAPGRLRLLTQPSMAAFPPVGRRNLRIKSLCLSKKMAVT